MDSTSRVYKISFSRIYPLYIEKALKKGRTKAEVDEILRWLTSYSQNALEQHIYKQTSLEDFIIGAPQLNPLRSRIAGRICGIRVEEMEPSVMKEIRYMDKLIDELATGKPMEKILRKL